MFCISACVFVAFNEETFTLEVTNEKLYTYLNTIGVHEEGHALVHNGKDFAVVKVVRSLHLSNPNTQKMKLTKPLLHPIDLTPRLVRRAMETISSLQEASQKQRLLDAANLLLENVGWSTPPNLPPPSPQTPEEDGLL